MKMDAKRRAQISAINNMLRQQSISLSRLHLFDRNGHEEALQARRKAPYTHRQPGRYQKYKQNLNDSRLKQVEFKSSRINDLKSYSQREDDLDDVELSPISRITMNKQRLSMAEPLPKMNISRLSKSKLSSTFTSSQQYNQPRNNNPAPQLKSKSNSISGISPQSAKHFFQTNSKSLINKSTPELIYSVLSSFLQKNQILISMPLIKQYRNCIYFGESVRPDQKHEGFLIFLSNQKIYYGEMVNEKKNGKGVQIDLENESMYIGKFENGRKKGIFTVLKPQEKYQGELRNGLYQGYGELYTNNSIYSGYFQEGRRHGEGEQHFPETGLTISGTFIHNRFTNDQNQIQESRLLMKNGKKSLLHLNNPQERNPHSYLEYKYDLRTGGGDVRPENHQNKWNQFNGVRHRDKEEGAGKRRKKSEEEEAPLGRRAF